MSAARRGGILVPAVLWGAGLLLTAALLRPLADGYFWIIDDHELITFKHAWDRNTGERKLSSAAAFLDILQQTEIGTSPTRSERYRPAYYGIKILKSVVFGYDHRLYFACNAALFITGLVCLGLAVARFYPLPLAVAAMAATAALGFQVELWPRLGTSEADAFFWSMLAVWAAARLSCGPGKLAWPLLCVCCAVTIGLKENFVLVLAPLAAGGFLAVRAGRLRPASLWWMLVPVLVAVPVGLTILCALVAGADFYSQGTGLSRFAAAPRYLAENWLPGAAGLVLYGAVLAFCRFRRCGGVRASLALVSSLCLVLAGNLVFYRFELHEFSRYAFPCQLLGVLFPFVALLPVRDRIREFSRRGAGRAVVVLAAAAVVWAQLPGLERVRRGMEAQIARTGEFREFVARARRYGKIVLVNVNDVVATYEIYLALQRFHAADFTPPVAHLPVFGRQSDTQNDVLRQSFEEILTAQPPVELDEKTMLVSFDTAQWYREVEFTSRFRPAIRMETHPIVLSHVGDTAVIARDTALYFPFVDPDFSAVLLRHRGLDASRLRFAVNGVPVPDTAVEEGEGVARIALTPAMRAAGPHPRMGVLSVSWRPEAAGPEAYFFLEGLELSR